MLGLGLLSGIEIVEADFSTHSLFSLSRSSLPCFHVVLSGVLNGNVFPFSEVLQQLFFWSIINPIPAGIIWPWLAGGGWTPDLLALTQWLFCLSFFSRCLVSFPVRVCLFLQSLCLTVCVRPKFHSLCLPLSLSDFLTFICLSMSAFVSLVGIPLPLYPRLSPQSLSLLRSKVPRDVNVW